MQWFKTDVQVSVRATPLYIYIYKDPHFQGTRSILARGTLVSALVPGRWSATYVSSASCDSGSVLTDISDWSGDEQGLLVLSSPTARRHDEER